MESGKSSRIKVNQTRTETTVTTKTFTNEQMFIETEFLPRSIREPQVNIYCELAFHAETFYYLFMALKSLAARNARETDDN